MVIKQESPPPTHPQEKPKQITNASNKQTNKQTKAKQTNKKNRKDAVDGGRGGESGDRELERRSYNVMQEGKDKVLKHWRSLPSLRSPRSRQRRLRSAAAGHTFHRLLCAPPDYALTLLASPLSLWCIPWLKLIQLVITVEKSKTRMAASLLKQEPNS